MVSISYRTHLELQTQWYIFYHPLWPTFLWHLYYFWFNGNLKIFDDLDYPLKLHIDSILYGQNHDSTSLLHLSSWSPRSLVYFIVRFRIIFVHIIKDVYYLLFHDCRKDLWKNRQVFLLLDNLLKMKMLNQSNFKSKEYSLNVL